MDSLADFAPSVPMLRLRALRRPDDDAAMNDVANASREADGDGYSTTLGQFVAFYDHLVNCDPARDIVVAEVETGSGPRVVGYGRVWLSHELIGDDVYWTVGHIDPAARRRGIGRAVLEWQERRAREIAAGLPAARAGSFLQAEANAAAPGRAALLEASGMAPIRWSFGMVRPTLDDAPASAGGMSGDGRTRRSGETAGSGAVGTSSDAGMSGDPGTSGDTGTPAVASMSGAPEAARERDAPLPPGLEIREVRPEHMRAIWEAEAEAFRDHWGAREPTEEDFQRFLSDPVQGDTTLWRVAWDGDQVAGMVRSYINAEENAQYGRRRGYVESISVRRPWRRRGLARALIAASFPLLRARGMTEGALGVDAENPSGALRLYESVGFVEESRIAIWRKAL